ncbi:uncharacterized protein LOC130637042 [Hydractinia symbiolongicarpus]|uniref:uncharacterized protein LOC130637035 n=1 Tax=Hydractinia symbiolongicarpus TaxID=13093 RepID=UPI002550D759|nr:uncharacterized protein LOC130637035 [Hydractinia symbiolongicarpus]XP_057302878.1 uncharacterized protein LOC130637042 [Hydractinia symbiolongicarpus]
MWIILDPRALSDKLESSSGPRCSEAVMVPVMLQRLQSGIERNFFDDFNFKPKQILCLQHLIDGHDVIAALPTGFGKTFLFQVLPDILPGKSNIVVVACPLNSIIEDQMNRLMFQGLRQNHIIPLLFKADVRNKNVDDSVATEEDFSLLRDIILNGSLKILFCHPEAILSERGSLLMNSITYQENVAACVIDEANCGDMRGKEFRRDFSELSSLKAFFPNIHFLCLTATAPPCNTNILINTLKLIGCKVIRANPNRRNVYLDNCYRVDRVYGFQSYEKKVIPIMKNLKVLRKKYPLTIIYMKRR